MNFRRMTAALTVACGLGLWGFARSNDAPAPVADPVLATSDADEGGTHDDAAARFRANQSRHWRHVAIGNTSAGH